MESAYSPLLEDATKHSLRSQKTGTQQGRKSSKHSTKRDFNPLEPVSSTGPKRAGGLMPFPKSCAQTSPILRPHGQLPVSPEDAASLFSPSTNLLGTPARAAFSIHPGPASSASGSPKLTGPPRAAASPASSCREALGTAERGSMLRAHAKLIPGTQNRWTWVFPGSRRGFPTAAPTDTAWKRARAQTHTLAHSPMHKCAQTHTQRETHTFLSQVNIAIANPRNDASKGTKYLLSANCSAVHSILR